MNQPSSRGHGADAEGRDERLLKQGRRLFIKELAHQVAQMDDLLVIIASSPEVKDLQDMYRIVHMLKGSAPMFQFGRIGKIAEELVRVWEWTQSLHPSAALTADFTPLVNESVTHTSEYIRHLLMEHDVSVIELEVDEQKENGIVHTMGGKRRLLIIDDDDVLRTYLVRRLELDGYKVDEASDVPSAKLLLRQQAYDLITLDLMMYPQSGYELFDFLKEDPTLKWVPLIVLSGRDDLSDKVRCFHLGADDYVTKPFQYEELAARIYGIVKRTKNFEELAFRDPLTAVFNRRYFDHQIQLELERVQRYPSAISLAFIDIDNFKRINDRHGHHTGDLVLQGLAHLLQTRMRSTDLVFRFGGEEFVVVMPGTGAEAAAESLRALLEVAHLQPIVSDEGEDYWITFSAGVSAWHPDLSIDEWILRADQAMYRAKQDGKDRIYIEEETEAAPAGSEGSLRHRPKLLVVDDDKILRAIVVSGLQHLPLDIEEAADGEAAYERIREGGIDLCILDGIMPKMSGIELLERLNTEPPVTGTMCKVIMLSGRKKEESMDTLQKLGVHEYMTKPFSMVELEMNVKRLLD
ncbi:MULTISPECIES: diguanylate cyclase [unclassified Paenibacillus]|uniref:diguanylate cyclase n=1 Tax=unclassified Paenibacillus TaxID=185978 RepID=UPI00020D68EA|nr:MULTISPECIES: diguanylate cyclase [unclassified Paenibacillus]EGL15524.1 diguanylate cyclase (GGDEF) domain protein [Paenibacillus sp. HGF7]EPD82796.1 diguanylate cyclase (GGDEF) domain-containing protein [Paenibacillus sp. HGH0039]